MLGEKKLTAGDNMSGQGVNVHSKNRAIGVFTNTVDRGHE